MTQNHYTMGMYDSILNRKVVIIDVIVLPELSIDNWVLTNFSEVFVHK